MGRAAEWDMGHGTWGTRTVDAGAVSEGAARGSMKQGARGKRSFEDRPKIRSKIFCYSSCYLWWIPPHPPPPQNIFFRYFHRQTKVVGRVIKLSNSRGRDLRSCRAPAEVEGVLQRPHALDTSPASSVRMLQRACRVSASSADVCASRDPHPHPRRSSH